MENHPVNVDVLRSNQGHSLTDKGNGISYWACYLMTSALLKFGLDRFALDRFYLSKTTDKPCGCPDHLFENGRQRLIPVDSFGERFNSTLFWLRFLATTPVGRRMPIEITTGGTTASHGDYQTSLTNFHR